MAWSSAWCSASRSFPGSRAPARRSRPVSRGIDRVTATELSFFLAIPALTAAGVFEAVDDRAAVAGLGVGQMAVGIVVAFVVAYASIAWLLKFVATNSLVRSFGTASVSGAPSWWHSHAGSLSALSRSEPAESAGTLR
jgi:undecaprenyl pyrophosphate phosphatase UppP